MIREYVPFNLEGDPVDISRQVQDCIFFSKRSEGLCHLFLSTHDVALSISKDAKSYDPVSIGLQQLTIPFENRDWLLEGGVWLTRVGEAVRGQVVVTVW